MNLAQSPHIPTSGTRPRLKDVPWLLVYSTRGLFELVRARFIFGSLKAKDILARNRESRLTADRWKSEKYTKNRFVREKQLARISYVIPRLSERLPWRSDCLIQAIAGQNWLLTIGAQSEIQIGVDNPEDGQFGAHAWLLHDGQIVTGGDISRYDLLLGNSRLDRNPDIRE